MVWPDPIDEPREDVRLPTFHKGSFEGGVPHSRIRVKNRFPVTGFFEFMNEGVILQSIAPPDDQSVFTKSVYEGWDTIQGLDYRFYYEHDFALYPTVTPLEFSITEVSCGMPTLRYRTTANATSFLTVTRIMPRIQNDFLDPTAFLVEKSEVREWSRPSEYWSGVTVLRPVQ